MNCALVLGIGNPYISDDGVGIYVVRELRKRIQDSRIEYREEVSGGLDILHRLRKYDEAVLIDAAKTGSIPAGQLLTIPLFNFSSPHLSRNSSLSQPLSLHTLGITASISLGSMLGLTVPVHVTIFAVEVNDTETFHEGCTPRVNAAIPAITDEILVYLLSKMPDLHCLHHFEKDRSAYDA